jgi:thioredoxin reductase (NADPH)
VYTDDRRRFFIPNLLFITYIYMYDVVIVGGASAGLTAAMYASRQALKTLITTKDIGGQALLTNDIENYPSFEHIGGFELMNRFEQQAKNFGAEFVYEEVSSIQKEKERHFTVKTTVTTSNNQYDTRNIILAFGKTPRDLN